MKNRDWLLCAVATLAAVAAPLGAQNLGHGEAQVTVLPKHEGQLPPSVTEQDLSVKVNGQKAKVTAWKPYGEANNQIELVVLIDSGARGGLGRQLDEVATFIKSLPPNVKAGIAYMANGRSLFAGPLSVDHAEVLKSLHLSAGTPGSSASPYFCLSDLAKNWPSHDDQARREVLMVTDGLDPYLPGYDPSDSYVQSAIRDAVRARMVIYAIYWENSGRMDRSMDENSAGQNLLVQVTSATGGRSFYQGSGNPVSFQPYFEELTRRLHNQYELGFDVPFKGQTQVEDMKLNLHAPGTEIDAPQQVLIVPVAK